MFNISKILTSAVLASIALTSHNVYADEASSESAVFISHQNKDIKWNKCPDFLPSGCGIAILHGDPAKDNVDVFFKVPAKSTIPLHWHTSAERMILVQGTLKLTYKGQKEEVIKTGSYAYGPAKLAHSGYCESSKPCILYIAFESPVDAVPLTEGK